MTSDELARAIVDQAPIRTRLRPTILALLLALDQGPRTIKDLSEVLGLCTGSVHELALDADHLVLTVVSRRGRARNVLSLSRTGRRIRELRRANVRDQQMA